MKNIKYVIFSILFLFFNIFYVHASCTNEEISALKDDAKKIKITYKHKGKVDTEDGTYYNLFDVKVLNMNEDLYISLNNGHTILSPVNGEVTEIFNNGKWNFEVYSQKCDKKIDSIEVFIPRFNVLSLDPLCEGIDGDDFALCGKYYEYDVDYDIFVARVNYYRSTHKISDKPFEEEESNFEIILNKLINYIIKYKLYVAISVIVILILIVISLIIKKRKKRGVLK